MHSVDNASQILLFCQEPSKCQEIISGLLKDYVITLTLDLYKLYNCVIRNGFSFLIIEVCKDSETFLHIIKSLLRTEPDLHIVMFGGNPDQFTVAEAFRLGVCDYFPNPVNHLLLIERILKLNDKLSA